MIGNNTHTIDAVIHSSGLVLEVMGGEKLYGTQNLDMHVGELLHDHRTRLLDRLSNTFGPAGNETNEINGTSFSYCQSEHKHHPLFFLYKVYKSMRECSGMIHGESSLFAFLSLFFSVFLVRGGHQLMAVRLFHQPPLSTFNISIWCLQLLIRRDSIGHPVFYNGT